MYKLVLLQTVAPDYRKKLFDTLQKNIVNNFQMYAGTHYFEESVKTDPNISYLKKVKNIYFLNRKFLFQTGMWKESLRAENLIMELNPRILSNWILLISRKILRKRTILWGHAWPRNGKDSKSDNVRQLMRQLADLIVTYTKTQAEELQETMPKKKIVYAPNSLYYSDEMLVDQNSEISNIIYVGRLTSAKKPKLLIKAYSKIVDKLPKNANLIIVGDGEEIGELQNYIQSLELTERIKLLGHIGEYKKLEKLYAEALLSVSPGYVGLSITQSFGFGVPMLISKTENHSPELEAANIGMNSLFFETDDVLDLAQTILHFYSDKEVWVSKRNNICKMCKINYSIESMAKPFLDLVKL